MEDLTQGAGASQARRAVLAGGAFLALAAATGRAGAAASAPGAAPGEVHVIAELTAKPGSDAALRDLLRAFATGVRNEPGCLHYELLEVGSEPGRFFTYERWADKASIDAHMQTPAIKAAAPQVGPLLAAAPVQLFLDPVT